MRESNLSLLRHSQPMQSPGLKDSYNSMTVHRSHEDCDPVAEGAELFQPCTNTFMRNPSNSSQLLLHPPVTATAPLQLRPRLLLRMVATTIIITPWEARPRRLLQPQLQRRRRASSTTTSACGSSRCSSPSSLSQPPYRSLLRMASNTTKTLITHTI